MEEDFRVGDWLVQPRRDCIQRDEEVVHLKPKAMAVLVCLAAAGGRVVTRDELFEEVWPDAVVSDATLTQCVVELRHAFRDAARDPQVIETVPRKGFRLIPRVVAVVTSPPGKPAMPSRKWHSALIGALLLLALAVFGYWHYGRESAAPAPVADAKSLAVLPFADLSEDRSQGWFAEGLAEELRTSLIRLRGLQVAGGISSARFGSDPDDLRAAADMLGVQYLLLGSVRRESQKIRVTARLVDAESGFHLWSETFVRPQSDVFDVQAEISESVAVALSITLGVGDLGTMPGGTSSFEAYEMTLKAWDLYGKFTPESMMEAIALLQRAVELDPDYAAAWIAMATFYGLTPIALDEPSTVDWLALTEEALDRARTLAPDLPALLARTVDLHEARGEWADVESEMQRASEADLALLPQVHFSYGIFLAKMGRVREALAHLLLASKLEPLVPAYGSKLGHMYVLNGRIGDALSEHERVWKLDSGNRVFQSADGLIAALEDGDPDTIARWLTRVTAHTGGRLGEFFDAMSQRLDEPAAGARWLRKAYSNEEYEDYWIAIFAAHFGDPELALAALLRSPDAYAIWVPLMAEVRSRPGFKDLVRELGLPEYWREFAWADFCRPVGEDDFTCE